MDSDRQSLKRFIKSISMDIRSAAEIVVKESGEMLKKEMIRQLKASFKSSGDPKGFFKAVKIYEYLDGRKPTVYVRLGIWFMQVFEEGDRINAKKTNLIFRLPDGAKLGLPKVSKKNSWNKIYSRFGKQFKIVKVANGFVVLLPYQGKTYAVYKIQPSVKLAKRLSFFKAAEDIRKTMPERLQRLLNA